MTTAEVLAAIETCDDPKALRRIADAANLRLIRTARKTTTAGVYRPYPGHPTNGNFPRLAEGTDGPDDD